MKKLLLGILCALSLSMLNVKAAEETTKDKINVYVFTKDGCPYCEKAKTFLNSITDEYGKYFNLVVYEVYDAEWNANENLKNAMDTVAKEFGDKVNGVPYIVIGNEASWPGYQSAFDDDIKKAKKIMADVMKKSEYGIKPEEEVVVVKELADSSIILEMRMWVKTEDYWNAKFYLNENVKYKFDENNISIPFNQLDVNLKNVQ